MDHEIGYGRCMIRMLRAEVEPEHIRNHWSGINWIVEVTDTSTLEDYPISSLPPLSPRRRTFRWDTSLRTTPRALLQLVRSRWGKRFVEAAG